MQRQSPHLPMSDLLLNLKMARYVYTAMYVCPSIKEKKEEWAVSSLHTGVSNCLLNTVEVKGLLGMQV